jgi:hypothetical protein
MKKLLLVLVTLVLFCSCIDSQWYCRKYGVTAIDKLSLEQLNESLTWAKNGATGGCVLSVAGAIGIVAGGYFIAHSKKVYPEANDVTNLQMTGVTLIVLVIPVEIIGLAKLGTGNSRKKAILEELKRRDVKLGVTLGRPGKNLADPQDSVAACLSIKFGF